MTKLELALNLQPAIISIMKFGDEEAINQLNKLLEVLGLLQDGTN